ncbi:MAG: hypothetical protein ABIX10_13830 [Acidimicrobiales bacterium]
MVAALALFDPSPAAADVEITVENGRVEVLLTDLTSTPEDVGQAFTDAGLDARIEGLPAGPSNVGRFVQVRIEGGDLQPIERIEEGKTAFMGFSLPEDWNGTLVISLGRPTNNAEPYAVASDAFATGEPLHCGDVLARTIGESVDRLDGLSVRVQPLNEGSLVPPIPLDALDLAKYGAWYVISGSALSQDEVLLQLQIDLPPATLGEAEC